MLHIQKVEEPLFLIDFKKKYPKKDYDSAEFAEYRPVLKSELIKEQKCLCAYCCGKITEDNSRGFKCGYRRSDLGHHICR